MYPFWKTVVAPIVKATGARRIVEIGALRGETTVQLLEDLGPDAELHVIDPLPEFDPSEHERRFGGRYVFHRDLSLNVLDACGAFDVALIDGDHNWYTVYNELRILRETARQASASLPVLVLHDVGWPYGRRDLYYAPEQIPAESRQPYQRLGMRRDRASLMPRGGFNATLHNAEREGGARNGVMTALDDFIAEHDRPLRRVVLPIYFGLAIVVEEARLAEAPALRAVLDGLETDAGKDALLELSEQIRLDAALWEQAMLRYREGQLDRAAQRYLDLLKGALLDEHYFENELRIDYLIDRAEHAQPPSPDLLADPTRFLRDETLRIRQTRVGGVPRPAAHAPYAAMGRVRLEQLEQALQNIVAESIPGDIADCGDERGGAAIFARGFLEAYELPDRQVWVADLLADLNQVREGFARFGLFDDRVRFLQGHFGETLRDAPVERLSLLRIGSGVGADAATVLDCLYDKLVPGGYVIFEDESEPECRAAVDAFRARRGIVDRFERVGWEGAAWRKLTADGEPTAENSPVGTTDRAPLAPSAATGAIDLSVVVVFFNMRREAARTLHSLTRAYQRDIDGLDYEVIVVDNGSDADGKLGEEFVRGFGPEFRYLDLGAGATPSPTTALNAGIRGARGNAFALMIDGAHVLTPGVLHFGMLGMRTYTPAIVVTQQWYVGPGQQPDVVPSGYDTAQEDKLFDKVEWPLDGYRLFEIGQFIGERDWFDGILESNCLFVPRALLEQVGGFDDSFSMPGGGYANLELYERLGSSPGVTIATILGEGSFHQVHGGTTTNEAARDDRRGKVVSYAEDYRQRRGRTLRGPVKPIHYVGALSAKGSWRTRARRLTAEAFAAAPVQRGPDGFPSEPAIVPDELKTSFIEAFWNSLAWQRTRWLGAPVSEAPTDLIAYQELIAEIRPDWIVETGTGAGGRALFFASICDLLGHGRVISVDRAETDDLPEHPRITYVPEWPHTARAAAAVRELTGDTPHGFVVIGSHATVGKLVMEFENFAPLVRAGSYVVVEGTILNGRPAWPGHGPGPFEAVRRILGTYPDFVQDTSLERYVLTFNPGGFLKRVS